MTRLALIIIVAAIEAGLARPASAADPRYPDWPCKQIKVPDLSVAAMWAGPQIDDIGNSWQTMPEVNDLVTRLAARRTPLEETQKLIAGFITGAPAARQQNAKLLFAGLFDTLNRQRSEVMSGIERYSRKEKELAQKVRSDTLQLRSLEDAPDHDQSRLEALSNEVTWETRIFEDRRKTINYVCEVPTLIEQRLFALSRQIQQLLE